MANDVTSAEASIGINVRKLTLILIVSCLVIEIGLVLADLIINYGRLTSLGMIRRLFNITREDALASWFGVTLTSLVALTVWLTYAVVRNRTTSRRRRAGWLILALLFTYMAVDDGTEIHERLGSAYKAIYQPEQLDKVDSEGEKVRGLKNYPSYPWHLLFVPFFAVGALFMLVFLWREMEDRLALAMIGAAILLFAAAVGLDFIEGLVAEHPLNLHSIVREALGMSRYQVRHFSKAIEEFSEMFGVTLLWVAFIRNLARTSPQLRFRFTEF
jgi:hypothetical protein